MQFEASALGGRQVGREAGTQIGGAPLLTFLRRKEVSDALAASSLQGDLLEVADGALCLPRQ